MNLALTSLLYVSESLLTSANQTEEIDNIIRVSQAWNRDAGITGALLCTGTYFAQALEGPGGALDQLMLKIKADPRHRNVDILSRTRSSERVFPDWAMAYAGPSAYVENHVARALQEVTEPARRSSAAATLLQLMHEFTAAGGVHHIR